jgi:membrane-associated phospholipid phosphatase
MTPLKFVRYWLPAIVVVAGVVSLIVIGTGWALEGAAGVVGAGLAIWMVNILFRIGASGDRERDREEEARRYLDEHGRWPDEPG